MHVQKYLSTQSHQASIIARAHIIKLLKTQRLFERVKNQNKEQIILEMKPGGFKRIHSPESESIRKSQP